MRVLYWFSRVYVYFSTGLRPVLHFSRTMLGSQRFNPLFGKIEMNKLLVVNRGDGLASGDAPERAASAEKQAQKNGSSRSYDDDGCDAQKELAGLGNLGVH